MKIRVVTISYKLLIVLQLILPYALNADQLSAMVQQTHAESTKKVPVCQEETPQSSFLRKIVWTVTIAGLTAVVIRRNFNRTIDKLRLEMQALFAHTNKNISHLHTAVDRVDARVIGISNDVTIVSNQVAGVSKQVTAVQAQSELHQKTLRDAEKRLGDQMRSGQTSIEQKLDKLASH